MDTIESMYQENILDHYKSPRNFGKIENASVHHHEYNPLCGDEIELFLVIDENKKVADVKFQGKGCAISQASASLLSEEIKGKSIEDLKKAARFLVEKNIDLAIYPQGTRAEGNVDRTFKRRDAGYYTTFTKKDL